VDEWTPLPVTGVLGVDGGTVVDDHLELPGGLGRALAGALGRRVLGHDSILQLLVLGAVACGFKWGGMGGVSWGVGAGEEGRSGRGSDVGGGGVAEQNSLNSAMRLARFLLATVGEWGTPRGEVTSSTAVGDVNLDHFGERAAKEEGEEARQPQVRLLSNARAEIATSKNKTCVISFEKTYLPRKGFAMAASQRARGRGQYGQWKGALRVVPEGHQRGKRADLVHTNVENGFWDGSANPIESATKVGKG